MKVSHTALKEKKYLLFIVEMYLKKVILLIHIVTWDHSECSIAIMTDVSADPVHGKVVLSNISPIKIYENVNWYHRYFKLFDTSDITNSSDWCRLVISNLTYLFKFWIGSISPILCDDTIDQLISPNDNECQNGAP